MRVGPQPVAAALPQLSAPARFLLRAALWIVVLFGLLRLPSVQQGLLVPFADLQLTLACALTGADRSGVILNQSCTGSDALALCLGAILAYPATWRRRLGGCAIGFLLISVLNTVRIGNLAWVVGRPELFRLLHLYLWPTVLVVTAAGYVFLWMQRTELREPTDGEVPHPTAHGESAPVFRFLALATFLVTIYYLAMPWLLASEGVLIAARGAARAAAGVMAAIGLEARASENLLITGQGRWLISGECVLTPLMPIYAAGALLFAGSVRRVALALVGAAPLFLLLATARLLVVALPPWLVGSHTLAVHAFYQVLIGAVAVAVLARRGGDPDIPSLLRRTVAALGAGVGVGALIHAIAGSWLERSLGWADSQGALVILPAFQAGLLLALLIASGRALRSVEVALTWAALGVTQLALVAILAASARLTLAIPVVAIRGVAVAIPIALVWWLIRSSPPMRLGRPAAAS